MHILIGAVVGGVFAAAVIVTVALVMRRKITAKNLLLGVLGGAIAGAVTTATLGASSLVGVGAVRQVGATHAIGADDAEIDSFARSCRAPLTKHRRRDNLLPGNRRGKGGLKELTTS